MICGITNYFSSTHFVFLDNLVYSRCCCFTEPIRRNKYNEIKFTRIENYNSEILL